MTVLVALKIITQLCACLCLLACVCVYVCAPATIVIFLEYTGIQLSIITMNHTIIKLSSLEQQFMILWVDQTQLGSLYWDHSCNCCQVVGSSGWGHLKPSLDLTKKMTSSFLSLLPQCSLPSFTFQILSHNPRLRFLAAWSEDSYTSYSVTHG